MTHNKIRPVGIPLMLVVCALLLSCSGTDDPTTPDVATNYIYGVITGTDEFQNTATDLSSVVIKAVNTAGKEFSTNAHADGSWKLVGLPAEVYTIQVSSPIFDKRTQSDSIWNFQYVGAGAYRMQEFRVAKEISSDVVYNLKADNVWSYDYSHGDSTKSILDSTAQVTLSFKTKTQDPNKGFFVAVAATPDAPCDELLGTLQSVQTATPHSRVYTFDVVGMVRARFGNTLRGRQIFLIVKDRTTVYNPGTDKSEMLCRTLQVIPVSL